MGYVKEKTGFDIGDPIMSLGNVAEKVGGAIVSAVQGIGKVVEGILKDPLPTLLQVGGAMIGIPPYVTVAVITAARGGNLEDIAKSAAISYGASSFMSDTQIGADIKNYTTNQWSGDFTDSMMEKFNLSPDQAIQVSKIASSSLNSALVGGINAVISGKPVMESISSGFTSGLIYSSTNSYFDSLNKDPNWGFPQKTLDLIKGASSSALNSIVSGNGDPAQAVGNYIASAFIGMGESKLKQAAKEAWVNLTTDTDAAKAAQDKYITAKAELDRKANEGEALRKEINVDAAAYQSTITEKYNPFKASYDKLVADSSTAVKTYNDQKAVYDSNMSSYNNYATVASQYGGHMESRWSGDYEQSVYVSDAPSQQSFLDAANAAAAAANAAAKKAETIQASAQKLYEDNKPMIDGLTSGKILIDKKVADFQAIKTDIDNPTVAGSTAANLKAASETYQTKYDAWAKTKSEADRSAETYTKAMAEVATRDATIDALNTGVIKVTSKDADSNWFLSNGMILTPQGKFVQDGQQVFTGAAGVPQKAMDFTANDGSNVDFSSEAGRLLSETDVVNICKRDYGFEPTSDEIDRLSGTAYTATGNQDITALADQKATAAYSAITGTDPTEDELAAIKKTRNVVGSAISLAKTGDADPWGNLEGAMLKAAEGEPVKFTDAQLTDMVRKNLVFEGGDYSTKQDAANAARLAGYTQFEYDNSVYTMQPGGPTEKALFQSVIDMQPNKKEAFRVARNLLGADKAFPYQGTTYTTAFWKPTPQPDAEIIGDGSVNESRSGTRVGLPVTTTEGLSYLTDQEKSVNQRIKEAYTGSTLSKIIGTPDDAMRTLTKMKDVALTPGQGVVNGIKGISDFYGIVTGNINNPLSQSMRGVLNNFDALTSDGTKNTLKAIQSLVDEAAKDGQGSAAWETAKQAFLNPETVLMTLGGSLGSFFPALAASAPLVAAGVPAAVATGVFIALNAASQGGSSGQEALEFVAKQLMNDPTVSMEYALEATILAGRKAGIPAAAISAVINSMPMGRALEGAMLKVSKSSLGKGIGSEVLTEIPDETLAKIFSNYASGQDLSTGLGQTAVNAAIGAAGSAAAVHVKSDAEKLTDKVNDLVKSGEVSPSKIAELKNEVSNLIGNVGYGTEPNLDLMSDQFFSGIISQEVAGELSLSGLSPEQIAQNLPAAVAHVESGNRIDPTFVDQFFTDDAEARQIAQSLGYTNPSPEVIKSLTGPISEADAQAKLDEFLSGMTAFESGKPIGAAEAQEMVKDLGLTNLSDADAISLATKIVQSVPADKLSEPKMTPEQVRSIIDEIIVANPTLTEVQVGKIVNEAISKIPAGISTSDISDLVTTAISNIPQGLSIKDVSKVVTDATKNLTTKLDTEKAISDAIGKINLPAGITSADVTLAIKTYMTENPGLSLADVAGKITESTKGLATDTSVQDAISTALKDVATTADVKKAIEDIKFPAGITAADVAAQVKAELIANPGLTAKDVTESISAYMTANPGLSAADVKKVINESTKDFATKKNIEDAIAGIKFPAGITSADVSLAITNYMKDNPGLTLKQVSAAITTGTSGLATDAGVKTSISDALKNVATKTDVSDAIKGIKFPAGLSKDDVANSIATYMKDNPGLSLADVALKITDATKGLVTSEGMKTALSEGLKGLATTKDVETAISNIKFPAGISKGDVSAAIKTYMEANPGLSLKDVADKITDATKGLATSEGVKTDITAAIKGLATAKDIETAIANIKFPAGLSKADVSDSIATYMKDNPGLSLTDVATKITDATKGLATSEGVKTDIAAAIKGLATTKDITDAISNIKFPAGLSKADVAEQITKVLKDNPGLSAADVTKSITAYMTANPGLTAADVSTAITTATKDLVTSSVLTDALANSAKDVKDKFDTLTQAQKDAVADQVQQGKDLAKAITDSASDLQTQITGLTTDVKTQYDALTQAQKDAVASQVQQGKDITKAIDDVATGLQANIDALSGEVKTQYDSLTQAQKDAVAGQVQQGKDLTKAITDSASGLQTQITGLSSDVQVKYDALTVEQKAIADALKAQGVATEAAIAQASATAATQIGDLSADVKAKYDALTQAQKDAVAGQVQQGKDLTKAINDSASGLQANISALSDTVKTQYDSLTQAQKDAVDAQVQQGKDLTKAINDASSGLQTQIDALSGTAKTQYDSLTQAQKDAVATQVQQGKDLTKAITDSTSNLQTQITGLSTDVQAKYDSLSQVQKDAVASQVQQGKDLTKAIADSASGLQTQITGLSEDSQAKYNALTQGQKDIVAAQAKLGVDFTAAINDASKLATEQVADVKKDVGALTTDVQAKYDLLDQGQKDIVATQVKLGVDVNKAIDDAAKTTSGQISGVKTELKKDIGDAQSQFNTRVDDLVKQGQTYQLATQTALDEIKATQTAEAAKAAAAAKAGRAATAQAGIAKNLQQAAEKASATGPVDTTTPGFANIGLKTTGEAKFEGPLEQYLKMISGNSYAAKPQESQQTQQAAPVQDQLSAQQQPGSDYFNYGQQTDIDLAQGPGTDMLYSKAGGLATPLFAGGGTTRHGKYAGGGLNVVEHSGKARIDFRTGNAVTGPGDGQSDDIPAMLADGEFVFPADVVAALGNGSTKAGSDKLYDMMHSIRAYHRSAKPRDLPPPAKKSPLDYLKKRTVRR